MNWTALGVAKPRDKMELADFYLASIVNWRDSVVSVR